MQVMFAALYTELIKTAEKYEKLKDDTKSSICYTISEAICSIDEDDKHTDQIELFLKQAKDSIILESYASSGRGQGGLSAVSTVKIDEIGTADSDRMSHSPPANYAMELEVGITDFIAEVLTSDVLTSDIGKQALKVSFFFMLHYLSSKSLNLNRFYSSVLLIQSASKIVERCEKKCSYCYVFAF